MDGVPPSISNSVDASGSLNQNNSRREIIAEAQMPYECHGVPNFVSVIKDGLADVSNNCCPMLASNKTVRSVVEGVERYTEAFL